VRFVATHVAWRSLAALLVLEPALAGACNPFDQKVCTLEARLLPISVQRPLAVPFADARELTFAQCVNGACWQPIGVEQTSETTYRFGEAPDGVRGTLERSADGTTTMKAFANLIEGAPGSTTAVTVFVKNASSGAEILRVEGAVPWEDEECHPGPLVTSL